jgi:membrane dipeptidase
MHRALLLAAALMTLAGPAVAQGDAALQRANRLLESTILVDGHNDLPWEIRGAEQPGDVAAYDLRKRTRGHTDLARLAAGHLGGQFWSIYIPGEIRDSGYARVQLEQFDIAHRLIEQYPEKLTFVWSADELEKAHKAGRIGSMLGLEGGHAIENSLGALRMYRRLGARYMTLTHNVTLDWADAAMDSAKHGGLTDFGREVVREMNRLGMIVDLSHTSPGTMSDALDVTRAPVIFSHSSARGVTDHPRNVPDSILARLPKNGGVVMVTFVTSFVSKAAMDWDRQAGEARGRLREVADTTERRRLRDEWMRANPRPSVTVRDVADHIEHIRRVAGVDHVGIGGDYDGTDWLPEGLEDVSAYPNLFAELIRRGWSDRDLRKLAGGNILRVMRQAEAAAAGSGNRAASR